MAAIDKIFGTEDERIELAVWLEKHHPVLLEYMNNRPIPMGNVRAISNFPESADKWLLKHCPIDWVITRIKEQYGLDIKEQKWRKDKRVIRNNGKINSKYYKKKRGME